ncbi:MAG: reverse transcriptase domain-containing protein [Staphylococcus haemolyticus]|nr:reverse transcriptase domain-containing protein [Staphylococcus haemolyticus]
MISGLPARSQGVHSAATTVQKVSQVMSRSKINEINPFDLNDEVFFPEWYYCFKINFVKAVPIAEDYFKYSLEDYRLRFNGLVGSINEAVNAVEQRFHECISHLLEEQSLIDPYTFCNREYVENELFADREINEIEDRVKIAIRYNILRAKAVHGDYQPLLNHLLAASTSPELIWQTFFRILTTSVTFLNPTQLEDFTKSVQLAMTRLTDVSTQIRRWYKTTELTRKLFCPTPKDTTRRSHSKNDDNRNMGKTRNAHTYVNNGTQGTHKRGPYKTNSDMHSNAQNYQKLNKFKSSGTPPVYLVYDNDDISVYPTRTFILDTGSSIHTVNDKALSSNVCSTNRMINHGGLRPVDTVGTLKIQLLDGHQLILPDVHYVPYLPNILSTHRLRDAGDSIFTNASLDAINSHTQQVVSSETSETINVPATILPFESEDLPSDILNTPHTSTSKLPSVLIISTQSSEDHFSDDSSDSESLFSNDPRSETESYDTLDDASTGKIDALSQQWHSTLGHPGETQFKALKKVFNLPKSVVHVPLIQCRGCCTSKTVNRFAKTSRGHTSITRPFEVIHVDVCGPFDNPKAHDNARYFLTIVDRFSRFVTAIPLARKSETSTMIQDFIRQSFTELRATHYPKQLRSDNGSEIFNDNLTEFLKAEGIKLCPTHPHSSAENGIAERMHRTLQDKVRTQMTHGNVPPIFWSEALRYSALILNWTPRVNLLNETPIRRWYNDDLLTRPELYPFGCTAFVTIPLDIRTNKMAHNSLECAYLGPDSQRLGHRFFSYELMKVFGSAQAIFRPNEFYFFQYAINPDKLPVNHNRLPTAYLPGIKVPPPFQRLSGQDIYNDTNALSELFLEQTPSTTLSVTTPITDSPPVVPAASPTLLIPESSPMPPRKVAKKKRSLIPSTSSAQSLTPSAIPLTTKKSTSKQSASTKSSLKSSTTLTPSPPTKSPSEPYYRTRSATGSLPSDRRLSTKGGSDRSLTFPVTLQYVKTAKSKKRPHELVLLVQLANKVDKPNLKEPIPTPATILYAATVYAENKLNHSRPIPNSYTEAMRAADREYWTEACNLEMQAHYENGTFTLVPLPSNVKPIGCRWVFNIKDKGLYKARLVAKGYTQQEGIDYEETFSPVIKHTSLRLLLAIAGKHKMHVHQMDVKTAFLNGVLKEELYMKQPPGYKAVPMNAKDKTSEYVLKLNKSIYGLKQAPLVWNQTINKTLRSLGFTRSVEEPCIYYNFENNESLFIALYVDDMLLIGTNLKKITRLKIHLGQAFQMKDLGVAGKFLGMNLNVSSTGIVVNMEEYINNLLLEYGMADCNPVKTPANKTNLDDLADSSDATCDEHEYRSVVGKLLYAANTVRYDINYIVLKLSRYLASPKEKHMEAAKRVLRYLKGTKKFGLYYTPNSPDELICYSDANLASETDTKSRSTTGSVILYGGSPVSWRSKLQTLVALSTVNSELFALCFTTQECVWLQNLMEDIKITHNTKLYCDNQPAIKTVQLEVALEGTKHIRRRVDFVKQQVQFSTVLLQYVPTKLNCADIFTKALPDPQFTTLRQRCASGIRPTDLL